MEELKKCPFCGGEAEIVYASNSIYVQCTKCNALMGREHTIWSAKRGKLSFDSAKEATESWNRRCCE